LKFIHSRQSIKGIAASVKSAIWELGDLRFRKKTSLINLLDVTKWRRERKEIIKFCRKSFLNASFDAAVKSIPNIILHKIKIFLNTNSLFFYFFLYANDMAWKKYGI
jgi:hypothetical protein